MTAIETLKAAAAKRDTATLLGALALLANKPSMDEAERMVHAATADVITEREGIDDALDTVFGDLDFTGSYFDAILICLAAKGVTV